MKKIVLLFLLCVCTAISFGDYTYTIENGDDFGNLTLSGPVSFLMTGGKGNILALSNHSTATILNTTPSTSYYYPRSIFEIKVTDSILDIQEGYFFDIYAYDGSQISIHNGLFHFLFMEENSTAHIYGGNFWDGILDRSNSCELHLYGYDFLWENNNVTGYWQDDEAFDFALIASDNNVIFHIVPEPATLALFGLGGLLIRRKK